MWSPASATFRTAYVVAAEPDATRRAATPPSSEAMRCSTASEVRAHQLLDQELAQSEFGESRMKLYLMKMTLQTSQKLRG